MTHVSMSDLAAELAETFELQPLEATAYLEALLDGDMDDSDLL